MLRRPNRASWNEESAGRPSPLAQLLASPRPLPPPHPSQGFVGSRHDLPGMIGYGKMQQKPLEGSMFSGAQPPNHQTSLTHAPPQMPTFSQANSQASSVAASLAALGLLTGTPHGGGATPTLPPPGPPPRETPPVVRPINPTMTTGLHPPTGTPDHGGGVAPPPIGTPLPTERPPSLTPIGGTPFSPGFNQNYNGGFIPLGQLLTSVGKRGVYNV